MLWRLAWLSVWSEVQTCMWSSWCHCHSLSLASVKSRLVLPFWYQLTRVVPDKEPLNGCVCVCVCVCVRACVRACVHACLRACARTHVYFVYFMIRSSRHQEEHQACENWCCSMHVETGCFSGMKFLHWLCWLETAMLLTRCWCRCLSGARCRLFACGRSSWCHCHPKTT